VAAADDKTDLAFSADEVEGDARLRELVLRGNVVTTSFRLMSPELKSAPHTARHRGAVQAK
jgi:hypothetical protein